MEKTYQVTEVEAQRIYNWVYSFFNSAWGESQESGRRLLESLAEQGFEDHYKQYRPW